MQMLSELHKNQHLSQLNCSNIVTAFYMYFKQDVHYEYMYIIVVNDHMFYKFQ